MLQMHQRSDWLHCGGPWRALPQHAWMAASHKGPECWQATSALSALHWQASQ